MRGKPKFKTMSLADLTPADYNPRSITDEAMQGLEASLDEFGLVQPIVWNQETGNIVGGHQRHKALLAAGEKTATVCIVSMTLKKERALNVALNNPHISGDFDKSLQGLLEEIREDDAKLFRDIGLDRLLDEEIVDGEDGDPGLDEEAEPVTQPGDLWLLGEHRVICGDSTDHATVMRVLKDDTCQCMWTDPPYGIDYENRSKPSKTRTNEIANDGAQDFQKIVEGAFKLADEYAIRPGSPIYVASPYDPDLLPVFTTIVKSVPWYARQYLVWVKGSIVISRMDYHPRFEVIIFGYKPGDGRLGRFGGVGWHGDDSQSSVFEFKKPNASKDHPTMKPVELIQAMLINSTRPGDFVYEPFAGSGSTLLACEKLGRKCLAIELEPKYCDVIVRRWEEETGLTGRREDA